jgi:hypothetical protein
MWSSSRGEANPQRMRWKDELAHEGGEDEQLLQLLVAGQSEPAF